MRLMKRTVHIKPTPEEYGITLAAGKEPEPEKKPESVEKPEPEGIKKPEKPVKKKSAARFCMLLLAVFVLYLCVSYIRDVVLPEHTKKETMRKGWFTGADDSDEKEAADSDSSDPGDPGVSNESSAEMSEETSSADTDDTLIKADNESSVVMLADSALGMGNGWTDLFEKGVSDALEETFTLTTPLYEASSDQLADRLNDAVSKGYAGVILASGISGESLAQAVSDAEKAKVPVVHFENHSDGYTIEAPDDLGAAMMKQLEARMAVCRGFTKGDDESFSAYNEAAEQVVEGLWDTANSAEEYKQFIGWHFLEFDGEWTSPGKQKLRASYPLMGISQIPDQDTDEGCVFYLKENGTLQYYLPADNQDYLECHWGEDGYSGSDSLIRRQGPNGNGYDGGNSTYFIDLSDSGEYGIAESDEITLTGRISSFKGYFYEAGSEDCLALNLYAPIRLKTAGLDTCLYAIQVFGSDDQLSRYADSDRMVELTGTLVTEHTAHHHTPVLMDVERVGESNL